MTGGCCEGGYAEGWYDSRRIYAQTLRQTLKCNKTYWKWVPKPFLIKYNVKTLINEAKNLAAIITYIKTFHHKVLRQI